MGYNLDPGIYGYILVVLLFSHGDVMGEPNWYKTKDGLSSTCSTFIYRAAPFKISNDFGLYICVWYNVYTFWQIPNRFSFIH